MIEKKISKNRIAVEKALMYNGLTKRFDILVYDEATQPYIIVECKAPQIKINQAVFDQAATYNFIFRAPFLVVTNGLETHVCAMDYDAQTFRFLKEEEWDMPKTSDV
jgi:type I site-specific restriction endonuclease